MAQVKEVKGPGGPRGMGPKPKVERASDSGSSTESPLFAGALLSTRNSDGTIITMDRAKMR